MDVPALNLGEYIAKMKSKPYVIKLDYEGDDFELLQTLDFQTWSPTFLLWETMGGGDKAVEEGFWLVDKGYAVFRLTPHGLVTVKQDFKSGSKCITLLAIKTAAVRLPHILAHFSRQMSGRRVSGVCSNPVWSDLAGGLPQRQDGPRVPRLRAGL